MAQSKYPADPEPSSHPLIALEGVVERLTFSDPETHYAVVRLKVKGRRDPVTVVGPLASTREGEQLEIKGRFEMHPKWGEQFKVTWWYSVLPATVAGIERYLASGLVKGIGRELAKRLVAHFGPDTLDTIDHHPERLKEVPGIGEKRIQQITKDWQEHKGAREFLVALQGLGLSLGFATKVYKQYGDQSMAVATANPYQLALDIQGLGFVTADNLAARLNLDPLAPARLAAGLLHVLEAKAGEGHVYVPEEVLLKEAGELLKVAPGALAKTLEVLAREGRVVLQDLGDGRGVFRKVAWVAETGIARDLGRLKMTPTQAAPLHLDDLISPGPGGAGPHPLRGAGPGRGPGPQGKAGHHHRGPGHRQDHHRQLHPGPLQAGGGPGPPHGPHRPGRQALKRDHRGRGRHHPPGPGIFPPDRGLQAQCRRAA